jgi:hypothetical protein
LEFKTQLVKQIKPEFLDFFNYGICKALSERCGKEAAADIFRRVGEIEFENLKIVELKGREPYDVLRAVGKFLEEMGYMAKISLTKVEENEVIIEMSGVSVIASSIRLTQEGSSPSHIMTNLMFAALKALCNVRADIIDLTLEQPSAESGYAREKWVLKKIG